MSELDRLGVDIEPLSSFDGVQMSRPELDVFSEIADPTEFIDSMVESEKYQAMNDTQRKGMLLLAVDHFQAQAEEQLSTHETFAELRQRIRRKEAVVPEQRKPEDMLVL